MRRQRLFLTIATWWLPFLIIAVAAVLVSSVQQSRADGQVSYSFDVVSIRHADDSSEPSLDISTDSYVRRGYPLALTIMDAYYPDPYQSRDGLEGAPNWIWEDHYTFIGKVGAADLALWKKSRDNRSPMTGNPVLQSMLRNALMERCGLAVHTVPGTIQGYALVVSKGGPNVKRMARSAPDEKIPPGAEQIQDSGHVQVVFPQGAPALQYYGTSMASLAADLVQRMGRPIVDRTGLLGSYDFLLWNVTENNTSNDPAQMFDWSALGLKLERIHLPYTKIHVDHVSRPTLD